MKNWGGILGGIAAVIVAIFVGYYFYNSAKAKQATANAANASASQTADITDQLEQQAIEAQLANATPGGTVGQDTVASISGSGATASSVSAASGTGASTPS